MEFLEEISPSVILEATKIFVNGAWVGVHRDPQMLVKTLRNMRRQVCAFPSYPMPRAFGGRHPQPAIRAQDLHSGPGLITIERHREHLPCALLQGSP